MRIHTTRFLIVCGFMALAMSVSTASHAIAQDRLMQPEPVVFATIGGGRVELKTADPAMKRLVFTVQGQDVTRLPLDVPIQFTFDTQMTRLHLRESSRHIVVNPVMVESRGTFFLRRDPFAAPQTWQYTVSMDMEQLPSAGRITIGTAESYDVTYRFPLSPGLVLPATPES